MEVITCEDRGVLCSIYSESGEKDDEDWWGKIKIFVYAVDKKSLLLVIN